MFGDLSKKYPNSFIVCHYRQHFNKALWPESCRQLIRVVRNVY